MLIKRPADILPSEITDPALYLKRREFIKAAAAAAAGLVIPGVFATPRRAEAAIPDVHKSIYSTVEEKTSLQDVSHYNNFYEFGTDKYSPAQLAGKMRNRPWTVRVEGEIKQPKVYDIDELFKVAPLEERIYRMRCVEGWSMVIPWVGFQLSELIKRSEPTANAKYVVDSITIWAPIRSRSSPVPPATGR